MKFFKLFLCLILILSSTSLSSGESTYDIQSGVILYENYDGENILSLPIYDSINNNFTVFGMGYPSNYNFLDTEFSVNNYTISTYDEEGNVEMDIEKNYHVVYDNGKFISVLHWGSSWYRNNRMFYMEGELYSLFIADNYGNYEEPDGSNYIIILKYEGVGESTFNVNDDDGVSISFDFPVIKWSNLTNIPIYDFYYDSVDRENPFFSYNPTSDVYLYGLMLDVDRKQLFHYGSGETWIFDIEEKRWILMTPNYIPQEDCHNWIIEQDNQNYICIKNDFVYEYDVQKNRYYHHDIKNNDCNAIFGGFTIDAFYFYDMNSGKIIIANKGVCAYDLSGNLMTLISSYNFIDMSDIVGGDSWDEDNYYYIYYQGYNNNTGQHYFNQWELRQYGDNLRLYMYIKFDLNIGEGDTVDEDGTTTETITQIDTVTETENNVETVTNTENKVETVEFTETYNVTIANTTEIITETVLQDAYFPSLYTMSILLLIPLIIRKYKTN